MLISVFFLLGAAPACAEVVNNSTFAAKIVELQKRLLKENTGIITVLQIIVVQEHIVAIAAVIAVGTVHADAGSSITTVYGTADNAMDMH